VLAKYVKQDKVMKPLMKNICTDWLWMLYFKASSDGCWIVGIAWSQW